MLKLQPGAWATSGGNVILGGSAISGDVADPVEPQEVLIPQSTTSGTPQNYTTFTIDPDTLEPAGVYELTVAWAVTGTNSNTEISSHYTIDGTPQKDVVIEPKVAGSAVPVTTVSQLLGSLNVGAAIVIEIEFWRKAGGGQAGVDHSYISVRRVS